MNRRARQGKTWRFFFAPTAAVLLAATVATTAVSVFAVRDTAYRQTEHNLRQFAYVLERLLDRAGATRSAGAEAGTLADISAAFGPRREFRITVLSRDGTVLADSSADPAELANHLDRPEVAAAAGGSEQAAIRFSESLGKRMVYYAVPHRDSVLRISMSADYVDTAFRNVLVFIPLAAALILVFALAASFFMSSFVTVPLKRLELSALSGEESLPALDTENPRLPLEYADLARALSAMSAKLRDQIDAQDERNRETEAILSGMNDALIMTSDTGVILRTNRAADELFGLAEGAAAGQTLLRAVRNTEIADFARGAADGEAEREVELRENRGGGNRHILVKLSRIPGRRNRLLVLSDITRLKKLERIRRDFVANVSHELKTPVTSIRGFIETLKDGAIDDPGAARQFLDILEQQSARLGAIIDDLLVISRLEQGEGAGIAREETDIRAMLVNVERLCRDAAKNRRTTVSYDCPAGLVCSVNPGLLEQAVTNLVENAIRYSPEGASVTVRARMENRPAGDGEAEGPASRRLVCAVEDNGIGIPERDLDRIFERFYRVDKGRSREQGGTGLGLSIVRHIALAHGGRVSVRSVEGEGSVFTIDIPALGA